MRNPLSKALAVASVALLSIGTISTPAGATSVGDGLSRTLTITESGSGADRVLTYTLVATDTQGRTFVSGSNPAAGQIGFDSSSVRSCRIQPRTLDPDAFDGTTAGCVTSFNSLGNRVTNMSQTFGVGTMTVTYSISASDSSYLGLLSALSSTRPVPAVSLYLKFHGDSSWYALYGDSDPSVGSAAAPSTTPENDPGVSFAGFLISGASGRVVDAETAGTLRFTGKRLNQVASATIGGIAVTVTSATRSALELDFDSLPEGKHDVVLTSKSGAKTTLRGFVTVN